MKYRTLPRTGNRIGILGLGANGIAVNGDPEEARLTYEMAIENGISLFDLAGSNDLPFKALGEAMKGKRDQVFVQAHFGADYTHGEYGWTMDLDTIRKSLAHQLESLQTDYIDYGFIHCLDQPEEFEKALNEGLVDLVKDWQQTGRVRHIGLSTHNPVIAHKAMDLGLVDLIMFSINPVYDYTDEGEYGLGQASERMEMYRRAAREGVGISVMKPFSGGQLLDAKRSPFGFALSPWQCIQYALDKPGVLATLPGIGNREQLKDYLAFLEAPDEKRDYSVLASVTPAEQSGVCVYCNHCAPCPAGINIGMVNKFYDLALIGDPMAAEHYAALVKHAGDCLHCGHCDKRCPFQVHQSGRMDEICDYFKQ